MAYRLLILDTELQMGGKEKLLYQFLARADRSRCRVAVCCLNPGGYYKERIQALGVPFYDGLLRHRFDAAAFGSFQRILRSEKPDVIETFAHPNTALFAFAARKRGLVGRTVVSYHAVGGVHSQRVLPGYLLPVLRRMDVGIAVAESQKRYLVDVERLPSERLRVIYNGVDTDRYHAASSEERAQARSLLGLDMAAVVLIAVGSLKPVKGLDTLIRAAAPVLRAQNETRLVLVGDGPDGAALKALAAQQGVASQVQFAGLRDDIEVVLRAADALVLSSRSEALPTVVIEAMATGLPVIATRVGGVPELVEEDRSALLVPPDDEGALRQALQRALESASLRRTLGERGREIVETRFGLDRMCEERHQLFEQLANASQRRTTP